MGKGDISPKEKKVKNKDLKECLAVLKALHSNNNLKPEQKEQVDIIISRVKKLGRG